MNRKFNFGCGGNRMEGWENYDQEVDISQKLPFPDGCASHVFAEHVVEHITYQEAFEFFKECFRILQPRGMIRIAIPDLEQISDGLFSERLGAKEYMAAVKLGGHGDGSKQACLISTMLSHGHKAIWTTGLLTAVLWAAGFKVASMMSMPYGVSRVPELSGLEGHGKVVGDIVAQFETGIIEGMK